MKAAYLAGDDDQFQDVITVRPVSTSALSASNSGRQHSPITSTLDENLSITPLGTPVKEKLPAVGESNQLGSPTTRLNVHSPHPIAVTPIEPPSELANPNAKIGCPFHEFGCTRNDLTVEIKKHIRDDKFEHLAMLCNTVISLRVTALEHMKESQVPIIIANDIVRKTTTLANTFSSQLIWRIDKYSSKFKAAKSGNVPVVYSPPFYSHRHGYRLCAAYAPFGDGDSIREFTSVFISILRNENDGILPWPFACPITFTLVNQKDSRNSIIRSLIPRAVPENDPFLGRPTAERNPAFGIQQFISTADMSNNEFVVDDVMFIKIDVDIHGIA